MEKEIVVVAASYAYQQKRKVMPGTAARCSTLNRPMGENLKGERLFHFTWMNYYRLNM